MLKQDARNADNGATMCGSAQSLSGA
ncbi:protein of unknown function (plasmid) [Caballeronia sp. S22]